jgi:hypothetical protein
MKMARIHQQTEFIPTVRVQTPQTLALRVGHTSVGLTAQQARHLTSLLIVQAEILPD